MLAVLRAHRRLGRLARWASASRVVLAVLPTQLARNVSSVGSVSTAAMGVVAKYVPLVISHPVEGKTQLSGVLAQCQRQTCGRLTAPGRLGLQL